MNRAGAREAYSRLVSATAERRHRRNTKQREKWQEAEGAAQEAASKCKDRERATGGGVHTSLENAAWHLSQSTQNIGKKTDAEAEGLALLSTMER